MHSVSPRRMATRGSGFRIVTPTLMHHLPALHTVPSIAGQHSDKNTHAVARFFRGAATAFFAAARQVLSGFLEADVKRQRCLFASLYAYVLLQEEA